MKSFLIALTTASLATASANAAGMSSRSCHDGVFGGAVGGAIAGSIGGPKGAALGAVGGAIGGAISGGCFRTE